LSESRDTHRLAFGARADVVMSRIKIPTCVWSEGRAWDCAGCVPTMAMGEVEERGAASAPQEWWRRVVTGEHKMSA
jgi:hypothetical protein